MTLTLEQRKAYALAALNNPVLGDIFEDMERSTISKWKGTTRENAAAREQAWAELKALEAVKAGIESALAKAMEAENETGDESL